MAPARHPVCLTIAGSDSGGGAGIQADLRTFTEHGVFGASAITAVTAQNPLAVDHVHAVPAEVVATQIRSIFTYFDVVAIKVGLVVTRSQTKAIADAVYTCGSDIPVVVDPVLSSSSGHDFSASEQIEAFQELLWAKATLITPNVPEAQRILAVPTLPQAPTDMVRALVRQCGTSVLLKGGHSTAASTDYLGVDDRVYRLAAPVIDCGRVHGTGCVLSAAIAARLGHGAALRDAVVGAKAFLHGRLSQVNTRGDDVAVAVPTAPSMAGAQPDVDASMVAVSCMAK